MKKDQSMKALSLTRNLLLVVFSAAFTAMSLHPAGAQSLSVPSGSVHAPSPFVGNIAVQILQDAYGNRQRLAEGKTVADFLALPQGASVGTALAAATPAASPVTITSTVQTIDYTLPTENSDGSASTLPTGATPTNVDPVWSPDESFIVFASNRNATGGVAADGHFHLWAISPTGDPSTLVQLTSGSGSERWPSLLSPTQIAYCESANANGPYSLLTAQIISNNGVAAVDQVNASQIVNATTLDCEHPSYAGSIIVFAGRSNGGPYHIYYYNAGNGQNPITQVTTGSNDDENPSVGPNSTIAFDTNATGFNYSGSGVPLTGSGVGANRNIFATSPTGNNIVLVTTTPGVNSIEPAWSIVPPEATQNTMSSGIYLWFSSNRVNNHYNIWTLAVTQSPGQADSIPESPTNKAFDLLTSDESTSTTPVGAYNNYEPAPPSFHSYNIVAYVSPRFLVNNSTDNPLSNGSYNLSGGVTNPFPAGSATPGQDNTPTNTQTNPPGSFNPANTEQNPTGGLELLGSRTVAIQPPALVNFSANEIIHIQDAAQTATVTTSRQFSANETLRFLVRLSDRQVGVGQAFLQIKDPDSKYQDAAALEHKVSTRSGPFGGFSHPSTFAPIHNEFNEATLLSALINPAVAGYNAGNPIYLGQMLSDPPSTAPPANVHNTDASNGLATFTDIKSGATSLTITGVERLAGSGSQYHLAGSVLQVYHYNGAGLATQSEQVIVTDANYTLGSTGVTANLIITPLQNSYAIPTGDVAPTTPTGAIGVFAGYVAVARVGYMDPMGAEIDCQAIVADGGAQVDATLASNFVIPPFAAGISDANTQSGNGGAPPTVSSTVSGTDPRSGDSRTIWLPLTPVAKADQSNDTNGGVLYQATWKAPVTPSDYYVDVIAFDNLPQGEQNWRIYDNVWGFTTQPFTPHTSPGGVLVVNDYMLPQKFYRQRFGSANLVLFNIPPNFYGGESYLTDVDVNYFDPNNNGDLVSLPSGGFNIALSGNEAWMTQIYHRPTGPFNSGQSYTPYYPNGLGVNSYVDLEQTNVVTAPAEGTTEPPFPLAISGVATDQLGYNNISTSVPSQSYDIWRVLSRGEIPQATLNAYAPSVITEPGDINTGQAAKHVLSAPSCVIWASPFAGDEFISPSNSGTITDPQMQSQLQSFVSAGGRLFVGGINVGFALTANGAQNNGDDSNYSFYNSVLGAKYQAPEANISPASIQFTGGANQTNYISHDAFVNNSGNNQDPPSQVGHEMFKLATNGDLNHNPNWTYLPPDAGSLSIGYNHLSVVGTTDTRTDGSLDDGGDQTIGFIDQFAPFFSATPPANGAITAFPVESTELKGTGANDRLVYTMFNPPAGVDLGNPIVSYASFGLESISQQVVYLRPLLNQDSGAPNVNVWSIQAQRTDLLHNLICFMRTGTITGQVTNTSNQAVGKAEVSAYPQQIGGYTNPGNKIVYTALTDASGHFTIYGVPPGRYDFTAYALGTTFQHTNGSTMDTHGGDSAIINLQVAPVNPGSLQVKVIDASTKLTITGATVTVSDTLTHTTTFTGTTNGSGLATFGSLPAGSYTVTVTMTGYSPGTGTVTVSSGQQATITISLVAGPSTISGTVTDAVTSLPIQGATITAVPNSTANGATTVTATSDANGNYTLTNVLPGTYTISAKAAGYQTGTSAGYVVGSNQTLTANFALGKIQYGTIYVLVTNANGGPVANIPVTITDNADSTNTKSVTTGAAFTDPNGTTENASATMAFGTYTVTAASSNGNVSGTVTLNGTSARITLALPPVHAFAAGLQMISVPYEYANSGYSLSDLLGYANPKLAIWQPLLNSYAITPTPPADTFHLGLGYWVRFPAAENLLLAGTPAPVSGGKAHASVALSPGWNMIGDPFGMSVPISSLVISDNNGHTYPFTTASGRQVQLISPTLYTFGPGSTTYVPKVSSDTIDPYVGYWIEAFGSVTLQYTSP